MDEDKRDKLVAAVTEQLQSDEDNLNAAIDIAIDFSKQNSITPKILLVLSSSFGLKGIYKVLYVFAKAAASLSEGKTKAAACFQAGTAAHLIGRNKEAEEQYKMALALDPNYADIHYNYGNLLNKMGGRNAEAEEQYKMTLALDPNDVSAHYNYGNLLNEMGGRNAEAEEQYKIALALDPNDADIHSNYGNLLNSMGGRNAEAEEQYKIALSLDPNDADIHSNYGNLLNEVKRNEEAEEQYKIALSLDSNHVSTHYNYGNLLNEVGYNAEAEEQYKIALALTPNHVSTHSNYGNLLNEVGFNAEAEEQYKIALSLDPNHANAHGAYGLLLFAMGKEKKALKEIKIASRLFSEKDDNVMEHLTLAWLYEKYADKYYNKGKKQQDENERKGKNKKFGGYFRKSGKYAERAGDEYIEAGKHAEDKRKRLYLSQGNTLKGHSEIRKLDLSRWDKFRLHIQNLRHYNHTIWRHDIPKFILIIDGIEKAADYYKEAAEYSDKEKQQCDACSSGMSILSSILDYMLDVISKTGAPPDLSAKIDEWHDRLLPVKISYKGQEKNDKGKHFVESVEKLIDCVENLEKYKHNNKREHKRELERCMAELKKVASNIEGPIQEIINETTNKIDRCKDEQEYARVKFVSDNTSSKKINDKITWILNNPIKSTITFFLAILASVIANNIDDVIKFSQDLLK